MLKTRQTARHTPATTSGPLRLLLFGLLIGLSADFQANAQEVKQFRGNLHTHSLWSDGDDYPEMIAKWYLDHGYSFLCFTDHNTLQSRERWIDVEKNKGGRKAFEKLTKAFGDWVEHREVDGRQQVRLRRFNETRERLERPGQFILLHGEEISDKFRNKPLHLNVSNVKSLIPPLGGESVLDVLQRNINAVESQRARTGQPMMIHVNHPNFGYAVTERDLMLLRGEKFFEVYNGHPGVKNSGDDKHLGTERMWDVVLAMRLGRLGLPTMYGIGVDDGHSYHKIPNRASNPGRGWVMVMAKELTPGALIRAMESGQFYASSGVTLAAVTATSAALEVRLKPEKNVTYSVEFIGTLAADLPPRDAIRGTDRNWSKNVGKVLARMDAPAGTVAYKFQGDEVYVRARVTSSRKHPNPSEPGEFERAWVQPVPGPKSVKAFANEP